MTSTDLLTGEVSWRTKCRFSMVLKPSELWWTHDGNIVTMAQGGLIHDLQNRIRVLLTETNCRLIGDITLLRGFQRILLEPDPSLNPHGNYGNSVFQEGLHASQVLFYFHLFHHLTNDNMVTVHCCPSATCSCPDQTKQIAAAPATWSQCKQGSNRFQLFASTLCVRNQSCLAHPSKSPSSLSVFLLIECKKHLLCIQTRKRNQSLEHSPDSHKESR